MVSSCQHGLLHLPHGDVFGALETIQQRSILHRAPSRRNRIALHRLDHQLSPVLNGASLHQQYCDLLFPVDREAFEDSQLEACFLLRILDFLHSTQHRQVRCTENLICGFSTTTVFRANCY